MSSRAYKYVVLMVAALALSASAHAQKFPERRHIREGNNRYESQRFADAEKAYRKALQRDSLSVEGAFNLGDAHYATGNFAAAEEQFRRVVERKEGVNNEQKAAAYYNLGNAQFQQQKLDEALESYKESLKLNPSDLEAKFNYAYTKAMQQEQNQQNRDNQQNQDNKDQQNDQQQQGDNNQQQDQQQDDNKQQEGQNQQQPEQPEGEKPKPSEGSDQQQPQAGPSKENEQVLNAVQAAEDKTREKVDAERVVGVARSGKNW